MPKKTPTYCRNAEEIAAALGIKLLAQRKRRAQQLAEIRAWSRNEALPPGAPPFPVQQPNGYWLRDEVGAWAVSHRGQSESAKRKTQSGNRAGKRPTSNVQRPTSNLEPELPVQETPVPGELFESKAQMYQRRLDFLEDKFLNPQNYPEAKIAKFEIDELRQNRPQIFAKLAPEPDLEKNAGAAGTTTNIGGGYRGVANFINANFPWVNANHEKVQRWVRSDYLPPGCKEPFPPPDDGNRFKRGLVEAWIQRWCPAPAALGQSLPLNIVELRDQAEKEQIEHDRWLRESERQATDRNYIRVDAMLGFAEEVGNVAFQAAYQTERERTRLFETDAAVQAVPLEERERWLTIVRRLVPAESALIAAELAKGLKALQERAAAGN